MGHGGKRAGAGRHKGKPNKRTQARDAAVQRAAEQIDAVIPDAFKGDAHAYLMAIYKDPRQETAVRIDAAKAALPFEKSRLAPAEPQRAADDYVPLDERLKAYARDDAIEASAGNVVEFTKPDERDDRSPRQHN